MMDVFYALAMPRRRRIVELLASSGQHTTKQICNELEVTAQAISQHLRILLDSGVVTVERHAQSRIYALNPNSISEFGEWAAHIGALWNARLDRIGAILRGQDDVRKN